MFPSRGNKLLDTPHQARRAPVVYGEKNPRGGIPWLCQRYTVTSGHTTLDLSGQAAALAGFLGWALHGRPRPSVAVVGKATPGTWSTRFAKTRSTLLPACSDRERTWGNVSPCFPPISLPLFLPFIRYLSIGRGAKMVLKQVVKLNTGAEMPVLGFGASSLSLSSRYKRGLGRSYLYE